MSDTAVSHRDVQENRTQGAPSLGIALSLTAASTLVPIVAGAHLFGGASEKSEQLQAASLIMAGLIFGPSTGQFYSGSPRTGVIGIGVRALGTALFVGGLATTLSSCSKALGRSYCSETEETLASAMTVGGMLALLGGTGYSLYQTSEAVERERRRRSLALSPMLRLNSEGINSQGLLATLRF